MYKVLYREGHACVTKHMYHIAHVPSTQQRPACHSLDPGKGKTTHVPPVETAGGWDVGRLGSTVISVP